MAMLLWGSLFDPGVVIECIICSYSRNDISMFIALSHSLPVVVGFQFHPG